MHILDTIVAHKIEEVKRAKKLQPLSVLKDASFYISPCYSLKNNLLLENATGIIAEFKRKSPSKGYINEHGSVEDVTKAYVDFGASGISVLTDEYFFGANTSDFAIARNNSIPILRKDFIVDEYQIHSSKSMGADVILLIAACLSVNQVNEYAHLAKSLGLEILLEIHEEEELNHICNMIDMVGINNRSLKTFSVDINRSLQLSKMLPKDKIKVAESGIADAESIKLFKAAGYKGYLIGELFMKNENPGKAFKNFVLNLK